MLIKGLQPLSLIDYPGKLSAIVFLFGCNFRCPYCQNPGLVDAGREERKTISESELLAFLEKRKGKLEGVVITGGEPCLNEDLPTLLEKIKQRGFLVKLDSNGSNPQMLKQLAASDLVDYFAMDVKAPLEKYAKVTGVVKADMRAKGERVEETRALQKAGASTLAAFRENAASLTAGGGMVGVVDVAKIKESIGFIKTSGIAHEFRTTVVPTLLNESDLLEIGKLVDGADAFYLQQFEPRGTLDPAFEKEPAYPREFLLAMAEKLKPFAKKIGVRGLP